MDNKNTDIFLAEEIDKLSKEIAKYEAELEKADAQRRADVKSDYKTQSANARLLAQVKNLKELVETLKEEDASNKEKSASQIDSLNKDLEKARKNFEEISKIGYKDVKAYKKAAESWGKRAIKAEDKVNELENKAEALKQETDEKIAELTNLSEKTFDELTVKDIIFNGVVFPTLKEKFPEIIEKDDGVENTSFVKIARAVRLSKKLDKQHDVERGYSALVSEMAYKYSKMRDDFDEKFKTKSSQKFDAFDHNFNVSSPEDAVDKVIDDKSTFKISTAIKTSTPKVKLALVSAAIVIVGAIGLFVGLFGGAKVDNNNLKNSAFDIINGNHLETTMETIDNNVKSAGIFNAVLDIPKIEEKISEKVGTVVEIDHEAKNDGYDKVLKAQEDANKLFAGKDNIVDNFKTTVGNGANKEAVDAAAKDVVGLNDQIAAQSKLVSQGLKEIAEAAGAEVETLREIVAMVNEPTISIEFGNQFAQNKKYFANPTKGGTSLGVTFCEYEKQTGKATVVVNCVDKKGNNYTNLIEIQMEKDLIHVGAEDILNELKTPNNAKVSMQTFDKDLTNEFSDGNIEMGNVNIPNVNAIKYSTTETYSSKSDTTKITATAMVPVYGDVFFEPVKVELTYKGKVNASDVAKDIEAALKDKLGIMENYGPEMGE